MIFPHSQKHSQHPSRGSINLIQISIHQSFVSSSRLPSYERNCDNHWTDTGVLIGLGVLAVCVHKSERVLELLLRCGGGHVNLVAEDEEGDVGQLVRGEEGIELLLGLGEPSPIDGIDQIHDAVYRREIILPQAAGRLVAAQVEGLELDLANDQLVGVGVERRDMDLYAVLLEHVQQGGLAGIVQPQEQNFGILVIESCKCSGRERQEKLG